MELALSRNEIEEILSKYADSLFPYPVVADLKRLSKDGATLEVQNIDNAVMATPERAERPRPKPIKTQADRVAHEVLTDVADAKPFP